MDINIQLNEGASEKLLYIRNVTRQELADILQHAIELYYQRLQSPVESPLEIAQRVGFIGCIQAEADLSKNYKSVVRSLIEERNNPGEKGDHR